MDSLMGPIRARSEGETGRAHRPDGSTSAEDPASGVTPLANRMMIVAPGTPEPVMEKPSWDSSGERMSSAAMTSTVGTGAGSMAKLRFDTPLVKPVPLSC